MFNSTHSFVGLAIAQIVPHKWVRYSTATAVIAANLPDIDSIAGFWGTAAYLDHHRGFTHSLMGVLVLSIVLAAVMYFFSENFGRTFMIALIAMATHPLLDYLNPYGVRPFLPWDSIWYYGDVVFIIDPFLDLILLLGLIAGKFLTHRRSAAVFACMFLAAAYVGFRMERHAAASLQVQSFFLTFPERVEKWALLPNMWNAQVWNVIAQSGSSLFRFDVHARSEFRIGTPTVRMESARPSEIVNRAMAAPSTEALVRFARFPVTQVEQLPSGHRVTFLDFRFYRESSGTALASEVVLDRSLQVTAESLSFVNRIGDEPF